VSMLDGSVFLTDLVSLAVLGGAMEAQAERCLALSSPSEVLGIPSAAWHCAIDGAFTP
jgi:hypothetical protein